MRRAVFLDRDGVINRAVVRDGKPYPPDTLDQLEVLSGVPEALARLQAAGFANVVVTNQPDVATGKQQFDVVEQMHQRLRSALAIDAIKVCYHTDSDNCACRKPKPGMLLEAAHELGLDIRASYMVGDRWRDIEAGQAAGCKCLYLECGYRENSPRQPYVGVKSLAEAADIILRENSLWQTSTT